MPLRPPSHRPPGLRPPQVVRRQQRQAYDRKRGSEQPWRWLYKTREWLSLRLAQLASQPLCERHLQRGEVEPATVANHRQRHQGDVTLFYDPTNLESVCKRCHDRDIQREERAQDRRSLEVL